MFIPQGFPVVGDPEELQVPSPPCDAAKGHPKERLKTADKFNNCIAVAVPKQAASCGLCFLNSSNSLCKGGQAPLGRSSPEHPSPAARCFSPAARWQKWQWWFSGQIKNYPDSRRGNCRLELRKPSRSFACWKNNLSGIY